MLYCTTLTHDSSAADCVSRLGLPPNHAFIKFFVFVFATTCFYFLKLTKINKNGLGCFSLLLEATQRGNFGITHAWNQKLSHFSNFMLTVCTFPFYRFLESRAIMLRIGLHKFDVLDVCMGLCACSTLWMLTEWSRTFHVSSR